jgi:hypothetical protein
MMAYTHAVPEWHAVSRGDSKYHRFNWRSTGHRIAGLFPYLGGLYSMKDDAKNRARYIRRLDRESDRDFDKIMVLQSGNVISNIQLLRYSLFNLTPLTHRAKGTLELRGLEHWLWKKMTVEPQLLDAYLNYVNAMSGVAIDMAQRKIDSADGNFALEPMLNDPESDISQSIKTAAQKLQHDVSLATFKAGLTDARVTQKEDAKYALYVLNNCFRHNPKGIADNTDNDGTRPYPLLAHITSEDLIHLSDDLGAVPMVLQRFGALDAPLKTALAAKVQEAVAAAGDSSAAIQSTLQQWLGALNG